MTDGGDTAVTVERTIDALEYGAGEGATQTLGRLADHLAGGRVGAP